MKVFEIGLGRTGTKSLAVAAGVLGMKAAHGPITPDHVRDVMQHLCDGTCQPSLVRSHDYVGGCMAMWFRQLDLEYPGAKFILPTRDKDAWLASCQRHWAKRDRRPGRRGKHYTFQAGAVLRLATYGCIGYNEQAFSLAWDAHHAAVRDWFGERVLEFDVTAGDGWGKLCGFLGCEVPEGTPFPRVKKGGAPSVDVWRHRIKHGTEGRWS